MSTADFPNPTRLNGRLYFNRADLENHKRALLGLPPLPIDPTEKIELVPSAQVMAEFGFGRRTLGRRIASRSETEAA